MRNGDQLAADAGEVFLDGILVHAGGNLVLVRDHHNGVPGQVLGWLSAASTGPDHFDPTKQGVNDWSYFDGVFTLSAQIRMHLLGILDGIPTWAAGLSTGEYATVYGNAATLAVQGYGNGGTFWAELPELTPLPLAAIELMNEPYHATKWAANVAGYTTTAPASMTAAKAADMNTGVPVEFGSYGIPGITANEPTVVRDCDFLPVHPYLSFPGV